MIEIEHAIVHAIMTARDESDALALSDSVELRWFTCDMATGFVELVRDTQTHDMATLVAASKEHSAFRTEPLTQFLTAVAAEEYGSVRKSDEYVRRLRESFAKRERKRLATELVTHAGDATRCEALALEIAELAAPPEGIVHIGDGLRERLADREKGITGEIIATHLNDLDSQAPIRRGHCTVIAARSGSGKSTLALHLATEAAQRGHAGLTVSLEMTHAELCDKLLAQVSGVKGGEIEAFDSHVSDADRQAILDSIPAIDALPLHVVRATQTTPIGIVAQCRRHMRNSPFDVLVVDYLQLMSANKPTGHRATDVGACSRAMKLLAMELNIAVILISQFNRAVGDEEPQLWHLKESSSIEQDASLVLMLHEVADEPMRIIVRKQRAGPKDFYIETHFDGARSRFLPAAPQQQFEPYQELEVQS